MPAYDIHAAVRRLTEAGVPEPQAVAIVLEHAQLLANSIATRDDLQALGQRLDGGLTAQGQRTDGVAARLDRVEVRLDRVEARLDRVEERLSRLEVAVAECRADIRSAEARIIKYMVTLAGAVVALVKLL